VEAEFGIATWIPKKKILADIGSSWIGVSTCQDLIPCWKRRKRVWIYTCIVCVCVWCVSIYLYIYNHYNYIYLQESQQIQNFIILYLLNTLATTLFTLFVILYLSCVMLHWICKFAMQLRVVHVCEATLTKRLIEYENTESSSLTVCFSVLVIPLNCLFYDGMVSNNLVWNKFYELLYVLYFALLYLISYIQFPVSFKYCF